MKPLPRNECIAVIAAFTLTFATPAAAQTRTDPAAAVRAFFVQYAAGDLRGASELWVAGAPAEAFVRDHRARLEKRCLRLDALTIDAGPTPEMVDTLSTLTLRSAAPESPQWSETARSRFTLQREGDGWRIAKWEPRERELVDRLVATDDAAEQWCILDASRQLQTTAFVHLASQRAVDLINQAHRDAAGRLTTIAVAVSERLGDPVAMATSFSARSVLLRHRRELDVSLEVAEQAAALAQSGGNPDALARSLVRVARSREELSGVPDPDPLARALALEPELEYVSIAAHAAIHLGRSYELRGRYREAFRLAELASRFAEKSGDRSALISASLFLGGAYHWLGDLTLSERHNRRAAELSSETGFAASAALSIVGVATVVASRNPDEGLRMLDEALQKTTDPFARATLLRGRPAIQLYFGRIDEAERDLNESVRLEPSDASSRQEIELARGFIAQTRGNLEEALGHFDAARGLNAAHDRRAREQRAGILMDLGRHEEARRLIEELIAEEETTPLVDPHRSLFYGLERRPRRLLLELLVEQGQGRAALEVTEQLKAKDLRVALAHGHAGSSTGSAPGMAPDERAREQAIDDRIRELNRRLMAGELPSEAVAAVREQLAEARTDLLDFRQRLYAMRPALRVQHPADVRIDDLPAHLDDITIVSYMAGRKEIFVFVVEPKRNGRRNLVVRTIKAYGHGLRRRVDELHALVEQRNLRVPGVAAEMYDLLIAPIEPSIRAARALCIIPDALLWRVPFQALGPHDGPLLVERMPVFYAPSITVLAASQSKHDARRTNRKSRLLAFANPAVGEETASLYRAFDGNAPLGAIPETESEVRAIAEIYGKNSSRIYVGNAARETTLKREASQYDVLHIATHGVVYDTAPMFSSLVLSVSPEDRNDDGVLEAREIAGLELHANLAVLAACETGRADEVNGDGVIGLSWAFLAAGCPTTVVSQWKAQSAATAKLMVEFHRQLARGSSKPEALRRAQLMLRRDRRYRHPFYWAPFVVIGVP